MQTKNVNLQANQDPESSTAATSVSVPSKNNLEKAMIASSVAPPLPPRGAMAALLAPKRAKPNHLNLLFQQQESSGSASTDFSPYKPVPLPKPVPPPYRQPPLPQVPIYSNPLVPGAISGTGSVETLNMQFPVKHKAPVLVEEEEEEDDEEMNEQRAGNEMRIPTLAEVAKMKSKQKGGNAVRPLEIGPKGQQHAWTEAVPETTKPQKAPSIPLKMKVKDENWGDGEPLLVRSKSGPLYPCGIDNPAAENISYVPSQPHQKVSGARGQVLLDSPPQENLYRAFCVTTEVDTISRGPETSELRDTCNRMYQPAPAQTIHSSLQNLRISANPESLNKHKRGGQTFESSLCLPDQLPVQPYYHLKDMRSGEEDELGGPGAVYSRVPKATKMEVEGVVVYGTAPQMKDLGAGDLCARSPAQSKPKPPPNESKRISSTSSESGHGTMQNGIPSSGNSGTLNTSVELAIVPSVNEKSGEGMKEKSADSFNLNDSSFSDRFSVTPPLPPLSPNTTPPLSPRLRHTKHKSRRTPDIVETTRDVSNGRMAKKKLMKNLGFGNDFRSWINKQGHLYVQNQSTVSNSPSPYKYRSSRVHMRGRMSVDTNDGEVTSTTTGLDVDSILDDADLSSVNSSTTDDATSQGTSIAEIGNIRRQLESLEGMYSEVMKALGIQNGCIPPRLKAESKFHKKTPSQLMGKGPTSGMAPIGGRLGPSKTGERHMQSDRGKKSKEKGIGKRFQRLESHVVTLARSVAHLSSEMRTQHMMFQELESLRQEVTQLHDVQVMLRNRMSQGVGVGNGKSGGGGGGGGGGAKEWDNFRCAMPSLTNPSRVKKLTHFFGDEPPLLRLFLKKLGYEKYACLFESEKIGIIELPYLTEERLQKIGIPMGPRMRILQEAQMSFRQEHFNIYIV